MCMLKRVNLSLLWFRILQIALSTTVLFISACPSGHPCAGLSDEAGIACSAELPVENIAKDPKVKAYLAAHKSYISLTSSPTRIKYLKKIFDVLDLTYIEEILLVLPERYSRDNSEYVIPEELKNYPKLRILRPAKDLGPISKLLFAAEEIGAKDPDSIIITIDDDTVYPKGAIGQLLKYAIKLDNVVGASAQNLGFWDISYARWPETGAKTLNCGKTGESNCDVIEGFGGVAYKPKFLDTEMLRKLSSFTYSKDCFASDDLVISYVLATKGVARTKISNEFIAIPFQLSYGFGPDALHRGGGVLSDAALSNININKYQRCMLKL